MKNLSGWLGCIAALGLIAGCGTEPSANPSAGKPKPPVEVMRAQVRELARTLTFTGSVEPIEVARMASPAEGPIVECTVREGDTVIGGRSLVRVGRSRIAESGLAAAREELRRQEMEYRRVERLVDSGALPVEQMDVARANLKRAEAQVAATETGAGDYRIEAPWAGVVSRVWIAVGDYVGPREPLVEIYDPASLVVRLEIPEQQALAIHEGRPVHLSLDAYPGRRFQGEVTRVFPELDRKTRTLTTEVELQEEVRLLSGMFARVDIAVETQEAAVVVPESALLVMPDGETIAFVVEGERASRRRVVTAMEAGGMVAIASGVEAGEVVVIRGHQSLEDGLAVRVLNGPSPRTTAGEVREDSSSR